MRKQAVPYSQNPEANEFFLKAREYFNNRDPYTGGMLTYTQKTPLPSTTPLRFGYDVSQGGEAQPPQTQVALPRKVITPINRLAPFPFGKGGGIGPTNMPINRHNQGEVRYDASVG